ncbi:hypothetical protein VE04_00706 [Pseudogymnoascus sp. 24MN13]|nr:hypothetical protein VE04_00706 [Pseudogymnoascus sp. 24MN13]
MELEARLRSVSVAAPIIPPNGKSREQINNLRALSTTRQPNLGAINDPVPLTTPSTDIGEETDEVPVDTLATTTFDDVPEKTDRYIGNFGPTSNHALFRTLSGIFAHVVHIFSPSNQQHCTPSSARDYHRFTRRPPLLLPKQRLEIPKDTPDVVDICVLPDGQDVIPLISQFSTTVGIVLPFVNTSTILSEYKRRRENNQQLPRPMEALVNIICAYTSSTLQNSNAKVYYRRALALLDEQTLRGSCLELIQALLLIASFQQNHQLSIASWTFHAVAVKAAFQLGLHSPIYYKDHSFQESELRKRLWFALVNQDRYFTWARCL